MGVSVKLKLKKNKKTKKRSKVLMGVVNICTTFNNIIIVVCDTNGNTLFLLSAGKCGFKGSRKSTPFAAQTVATEAAIRAMRDYYMRSIIVIVRGPGGGRDPAIKSLKNNGLTIVELADNTPIPHNGCRPKKKRRV